ncbi:unnamed protein product [Prorocentrum cordatum]|uniref:Endonuclease/exonuclease/phosphatase domain-containing protein n=1 Tax=Prorocentrum cordatum TaxID=2364126 RepID=A0ABN9QWG0_9DINO|nr:unnamed protein product [Polarella glacialis]
MPRELAEASSAGLRPEATATAAAAAPASEDEAAKEVPPVLIKRVELVRGHRPVISSQVPVYIGLEDRDGRCFEDDGRSQKLRYCWTRGPVCKPCVFHPHKTSQFRDVTKTWQNYCSKDCFLRGWWNMPENLWNMRPTDVEIQEEMKDSWVKVADTKDYCPKQEDIDRPLRLDVFPILDDGCDASTGGMSLITGTVIPTPNEARTRRMISRGAFGQDVLRQQFKVMDWNVLADMYATESQYPYCERWALSWNWRQHLILKELKSTDVDIITLQEVQRDLFDDWFRPQLAEAGYEGVFQQKKREPCFHRGKYTSEGCATFWRHARFRKTDKQVIDYDKLMEQQLQMAHAAYPEGNRQRTAKGNIGLAVTLEDLNGSRGQVHGSGGGPLVCVVNTHILADPEFTDVKIVQCHNLLQSLSTCSGLQGIPLVVCGDFNSLPQSAVYEYIVTGCIRPDHKELRSGQRGLLDSINFGHHLKLSSAYEACSGREAAYTNYTELFKGTLDYIFFSSDSLGVLAISEVDAESHLRQETALPSSTRPSDHLPLVAAFTFREAPRPDPYDHRPGMAGIPSGMGNPLPVNHQAHAAALNGAVYQALQQGRLPMDGSPPHMGGGAGLRFVPPGAEYPDAWGRAGW